MTNIFKKLGVENLVRRDIRAILFSDLRDLSLQVLLESVASWKVCQLYGKEERAWKTGAK